MHIYVYIYLYSYIHIFNHNNTNNNNIEIYVLDASIVSYYVYLHTYWNAFGQPHEFQFFSYKKNAQCNIGGLKKWKVSRISSAIMEI